MPTPVTSHYSYKNASVLPSYSDSNKRLQYSISKVEFEKESRITREDTTPIPIYMIGIKKKIEHSRRILLYKDNWDDNGALQINPLIFERAVSFLERYAERIYDVCKKILIPPDIVPVNDGSVDLEWNLGGSMFLINFKNIEEPLAFYYGEFKDNENIIFDTNGQIVSTAVNDKFASYLSYLSKEADIY